MSTEHATADDLLAGEDETRDVTLSGGKVVTVRALSRYESFLIAKTSQEGDGNDYENKAITTAMISPKMTEKQVEAWRKRPSAAGDVARVSDAIRELAGTSEGAQKSDVPASGD
ncbi:hypothetical protein [Actinoplanes awajinensis]|uniref:Phage tail protein n=1 Tax=Actinoplanes awajinensis subsp. mycoplanecinus TaxID=135947 RepID=A0A101J8Y5_9ACTN|nr:hypothetical protein [Actinoplanes awajinensis]KUL22355.1 hypothetical protein ADL15_48345 [Actinoplanes awajinensis subsp. mycoplanecinus]